MTTQLPRLAANVRSCVSTGAPTVLTRRGRRRTHRSHVAQAGSHADQIRTLCAEAATNTLRQRLRQSHLGAPLRRVAGTTAGSLSARWWAFRWERRCPASQGGRNRTRGCGRREEVDMVFNIGRLKDRSTTPSLTMSQASWRRHINCGALVKVIFETCLLTTEEKIAASASSAGSRRGLRQDVHRLQPGRRHTGRRPPHAPDGGLGDGRQSGRRRAQRRRCPTHGGRGRRHPNRRQRRDRHRPDAWRSDPEPAQRMATDRGKLLMSDRVTDFALIIGHVWRCYGLSRRSPGKTAKRPGSATSSARTSARRSWPLILIPSRLLMRLAQETGLEIDELYRLHRPPARACAISAASRAKPSTCAARTP